MFRLRMTGALARRWTLAAGVALLATGCDDDSTGPFAPEGRRIFGVDASNNLVQFGSANPGRARTTRITGTLGGESMVGIDFRPADGRLYGVSSANRIYTVDTLTAVATPVGAAAFTPALVGTGFGVDFNPAADRIRLHASEGQNLRLNQLTGATAATDTALTYASGDAGFGVAPRIVATAYTNSVAGATSTSPTVLFAIDSNRDVLTLVNPPNAGRMTTVGPLGVNTTEDTGFDIFGPDSAREAYVSLTVGTRSELYTINLANGTTSRVGRIGSELPLRGIAVAP